MKISDYERKVPDYGNNEILLISDVDGQTCSIEPQMLFNRAPQGSYTYPYTADVLIRDSENQVNGCGWANLDDLVRKIVAYLTGDSLKFKQISFSVTSDELTDTKTFGESLADLRDLSNSVFAFANVVAGGPYDDFYKLVHVSDVRMGVGFDGIVSVNVSVERLPGELENMNPDGSPSNDPGSAKINVLVLYLDSSAPEDPFG